MRILPSTNHKTTSMRLSSPVQDTVLGVLSDITETSNNAVLRTPESSPAAPSKKHKLWDFPELDGNGSKARKKLFQRTPILHKPPKKPVRHASIATELLQRGLGISRGINIRDTNITGSRFCLQNYYSRPSDCLTMLDQLPFSVAFANHESLLAVCTETGALELIDTKPRCNSVYGMDDDRSIQRIHGWLAHNNAVFGVTFSEDDSLLATASGDQTSNIFDLATQQCITRLGRRGVEGYHSHSVKEVSFCQNSPYNLMTCSRDGSIIFWDMRTHGITIDGDHYQKPVLRINQAHEANGRTCSITAAEWIPTSTTQAVSACSANSIVKLWDLRNIHSLHPSAIASTPEPQNNARRAFGITSLSVSPMGDRVYACSRDNSVYAYAPSHLEAGVCATYKDPRLRVSSFYVKTACSKDGRTLACGGGSQGASNGVVLFDVSDEDRCSASLLEGGHGKDVTAVAWSNEDQLASISDDGTVRVWNPAERGEALELQNMDSTDRFSWGFGKLL
ncbi:WD repeat protein Cdt2 [Schizosaccharomyces japonicus yFS275]|uniref:WD repeat protein Cdt2 n=1 Tax=Schizosaccharomyces japonicus (strain yFS275 / FY16936) TaxID=402676 RepID=B6K464_SCHJY|nr:WD repeat protein Cdt2 [Schizosaccharomyces japonicus yFS275]EEB08271.1 WD repeat protein Cdt2 [Schizosaccharomyces japonicus yFS275]